MQIEVDTAVLQATVRARAIKDSALEAKACGLMRQYGFLLPAQAKDFFRELADHLKWHNLKEQMK